MNIAPIRGTWEWNSCKGSPTTSTVTCTVCVERRMENKYMSRVQHTQTFGRAQPSGGMRSYAGWPHTADFHETCQLRLPDLMIPLSDSHRSDASHDQSADLIPS